MQMTLQNLTLTLRDFYGKFHRKTFIQYRPSSPWWHSWVDWGTRAKTPWHLGAPESTSSLTHQANVFQDLVRKLHHQGLPYISAYSVFQCTLCNSTWRQWEHRTCSCLCLGLSNWPDLTPYMLPFPFFSPFSATKVLQSTSLLTAPAIHFISQQVWH